MLNIKSNERKFKKDNIINFIQDVYKKGMK